jgi:hypothetical protein
MRTYSLLLVTLITALLLPVFASAQAHELSLTVGGDFPAGTTFNINPGFAIEGAYAGRLLSVPLVSLYWELPVAYAAKNTGSFLSTSGVEQRNYSSLFVAPGLRLKIAPGFPISPYLAAGVGVAHFNLAATANTPQQSTNTSVVDFGGGLDMKILPFISLRGEVRDYYSGNPQNNFGTGIPGLGTIAGRQHNILPTVGLVLRF